MPPGFKYVITSEGDTSETLLSLYLKRRKVRKANG
jgi:hypothetical protein